MLRGIADPCPEACGSERLVLHRARDQNSSRDQANPRGIAGQSPSVGPRRACPGLIAGVLVSDRCARRPLICPHRIRMRDSAMRAAARHAQCFRRWARIGGVFQGLRYGPGEQSGWPSLSFLTPSPARASPLQRNAPAAWPMFGEDAGPSWDLCPLLDVGYRPRPLVDRLQPVPSCGSAPRARSAVRESGSVLSSGYWSTSVLCSGLAAPWRFLSTGTKVPQPWTLPFSVPLEP